MSAKTLLSVGVLLGAAIAAPNAALAQFGPPPGPPPMLAGPPPGLGAGGPPPGLGVGGPPLGGPSAGPVAGLPPRGGAGAPPREIAGGPHLDGPAGLHGFDRGGSASLRGVEARAAAYSAHSYTRNSYASYGYGHDYGRGYRHWPYAAAAAYAYGRSYASSDDGCYYVSAYRRCGTRRVLSWKLIEADGPWRLGLAPGRRPFGRTQFACNGRFPALDRSINKLYGLV
jgi:hypothetical protein